MSKKESTLKTLKDVIFVYTSVDRPQKQLNKDNKPAKSDHPLEFHAWEIKVLVTESYFKAMKKAFSGAKNFPNVKEYTASECVDKFNIDEPDEDMVLIKFSQGCLYGPAGNRKDARPVTQIGIAGKVQDKNGLAITQATPVGNGTKGHLQFNPVTNDFGLYLYPVAICITELVEYVPAGGGFDEDAFGITELAESDAPFEAEEEEEDQFGDMMF